MHFKTRRVRIQDFTVLNFGDLQAFANADIAFQGEGIEMLIVDDMAEGGVKNHRNSADIFMNSP